MRKRWRCLALMLFALLSLTACGGPSPASEAQLREDLERSEASRFSYYSEQLQATVTDFNVVKRQTVVEDQKDTVWVQISIEGPKVKGNFHYIMSYGLYNDGWKLEDVSQDRENGWRIDPLAGPEESLIASQLPSDAEIISSDIVLDTEYPYATYEYTRTETYPYCEVIYKTTLNFAFDNSADGVWYFTQSWDSGTVENWDIDGVWSIGDENKQFYYALCLNDFSPQGIANGGMGSNYTYETDGWYRKRFYLGYQKDGTWDRTFSARIRDGSPYNLPISYLIEGYDIDYNVNYYGVFVENDPVFGHRTPLNKE